MAGPIRFTLQVQGLKELRRAVTDNALLVAPWHAAMGEMGQEGLDAAKRAAPVGPSFTGHIGGNTAGKLRSRMQAKPMPLWVAIETTAVRPWAGHGNYAYTKRVEWDARLRHQHWLRDAVSSAQGRFASALNGAATRIEAAWAAIQ